MKVQVPSEEVIEANRLLNLDVDPTPIPKKPYHKGFRDAVDYCNEQLESSATTKRPFLSDGDIRKAWSESADVDWLHGARWARDKYEARDMGDVTAIAPQKKMVLRPWHEIYQIETKAEGRNFLSLGMIALAKDNIDKLTGKAIEDIEGWESFPPEWFVEV